MKKSLNVPNLLQGCVSVFLGLLLFWLCATRVCLQYITPRTIPYLYFASFLLLVIGAFSFSHLKDITHIRRYTPLLALLIPLVLVGVSIGEAKLWSAPLFPAQAEEADNPLLEQQTYTMTMPAYAGRVLHGYNADHQTITVLADETYWWLSEIYNNPTAFVGYTVHTMGQVLKNPKFFTADCFSPTRKLMTCCVADLYTIGFKCQYAGTQALSEGDWVTVSGKLEMVGQGASQELRLVSDAVTPCQPPSEPYVYAY